jgi:hypothetical protein
VTARLQSFLLRRLERAIGTADEVAGRFSAALEHDTGGDRHMADYRGESAG